VTQQRYYTLVLTKGTHRVDQDTADLLCEAIERGERKISVDVDTACDGFSRSAMIIFTSHVVALIAEEGVDVDFGVHAEKNVIAFSPRSKLS